MPTKLIARFPYQDKDMIIYQDTGLDGRDTTPPYGEGYYNTKEVINHKHFKLEDRYPGIGIEGVGIIDFVLPISVTENQVRWHSFPIISTTPDGPISTLIKMIPWYSLVAQLDYALQQTENVRAPKIVWETIEQLTIATGSVLSALETWAIGESKGNKNENKN